MEIDKMNRKVTLLLLIILVILNIVGCGSASTPEPTPTPHPGKSIVTSRCIGCHSMNQIENSAFNARGWQLVVERMQMLGVQLSDDQVVEVVDYLAMTYPITEE
jgi:mono/diheme cytochrome c family protein